MSVRNATVLFLALSTLLFLAACGSSNGTANPVPPPSGSFSDSNLNGTYVFSISGVDEGGFPYAMVGTLTANGSGGITGGSLDINDTDTAVFTSGPIPAATINNGSYHVGIDGRGTATFSTPSITGGSFTLDFVLSSSSQGLVTEFDAFGSGSGTLDAQTAGVTPTGPYAFSLAGAAYTSGAPWAMAGNFAVTGTSIAGLDDLNEGGLLPYPDNTFSGSLILGPSATPATTLTAGPFTGTFDVYAIDANHLKFIEIDQTATLSGDAFSQTSTTIPQGTFAFTLTGDLNATSGAPFVAGGFMVTDGAGNITNASTEDFNGGGTNLSNQTSPGTFTATYTAAGAGRFALGNFATWVGGTSYVAYPSSGGLLLLEIDNAAITTGAAYQQTAGATFASGQGYGMNLSGVNDSTGSPVEVDDIAEFTAASGGTLSSGVIDENSAPSGIPNQSLALTAGTYGTIGSTGRYGISATAGTTNNSTLLGGFTLSFYTVDGTTFPFIEMDGDQVSTGVIVEQSPTASSPALARSRMFVVRPLINSHIARKKQN